MEDNSNVNNPNKNSNIAGLADTRVIRQKLDNPRHQQSVEKVHGLAQQTINFNPQMDKIKQAMNNLTPDEQ